MGRPKLLLPWGETTVIEHVLARWQASRVEQVVVVVDPADERLAAICRAAGVQVVVPPVASPEMKDSVDRALEWIASQGPAADDAWLVAPADMPTLRPTVIDRLIAAHAAALGSSAPRPIRAPQHAGRRGHPVLFPWPMAADVARLGPDEGLNVLLARHGVECLDVEAGAIPEDFDTPEDYDRLRAGRRT